MIKPNDNFRLSNEEREALKTALTGFQGEIYLFGSRTDPHARGGDIDILLRPSVPVDRPMALVIAVQSRFFEACEEDIDVVIFKPNDPFFEGVLSRGRKIDPAKL